jgi:hypothetical protein
MKCYYQQIQAVVDCQRGEDENSIKKHISNMKSEMKKREPNRMAIGDAMKRTVEHRQIFCHDNATSAVLEEFPALRFRIYVSLQCLNFMFQMVMYD